MAMQTAVSSQQVWAIQYGHAATQAVLGMLSLPWHRLLQVAPTTWTGRAVGVGCRKSCCCIYAAMVPTPSVGFLFATSCVLLVHQHQHRCTGALMSALPRACVRVVRRDG